MISFTTNDTADWGEARTFLYSNSTLVCESFEKGHRFISYGYSFTKGT